MIYLGNMKVGFEVRRNALHLITPVSKSAHLQNMSAKPHAKYPLLFSSNYSKKTSKVAGSIPDGVIGIFH